MKEDIEALNNMTYLNKHDTFYQQVTRNGHKVMTPLGLRSVEVTGECDTAFSRPATIVVKGQRVKGYISRDQIKWDTTDNSDDAWVDYYLFRPYQYTDKQTAGVIALTWCITGSFLHNAKDRNDKVADIMAAYLKKLNK